MEKLPWKRLPSRSFLVQLLVVAYVSLGISPNFQKKWVAFEMSSTEIIPLQKLVLKQGNYKSLKISWEIPNESLQCWSNQKPKTIQFLNSGFQNRARKTCLFLKLTSLCILWISVWIIDTCYEKLRKYHGFFLVNISARSIDVLK